MWLLAKEGAASTWFSRLKGRKEYFFCTCFSFPWRAAELASVCTGETPRHKSRELAIRLEHKGG